MKLLSLLPRFQTAYRQLATLASRETWSRADIATYQLSRINAIWKTGIRHVPYYRQLHDQRRLPDEFESLDEYRSLVPCLTKEEVVRNCDGFLSERASRGNWHRTSGSTGMPLRVFRAHHEHQEILRSRYRFYAMWGLDIFDRTAWVWSTHQGHASLARLRQRCEDHLRQRLRLPANRLGDTDLRTYLRRIEAFQPRGIYGFSRAVHLLALKAVEVGFQCDPLKVIVLTGEAAPTHLKMFVSGALGAPVAMEYGTVECGLIAGDAPDGTCRIREDAVLLESLPRGDGFYDLVVTVFATQSFPLLRYRTGDVTDQPIVNPEQGFSILGDIAGRNDDLIQTKTGRLLHPACIDELFEVDFASQVYRYSVHQYKSGTIHVKVQPAGSDATGDWVQLSQRLRELLEGFDVQFEIVDAISQTAAGKQRLVTSELSPVR